MFQESLVLVLGRQTRITRAKKKTPRRRPIFPTGNRAVLSALEGLTSVFGMGTGGAPPLCYRGDSYEFGVGVNPLVNEQNRSFADPRQ